MNRYEISKYVDSVAQDIMANRGHWYAEDLHDVAREWASNSQHVINYAQAHEFVQALEGVERKEAESHVVDSGMHRKSYDNFAVQIAYWALYKLIVEAVTEKLEQEEVNE